MTIGEIIYNYRTENGLTMEMFAKKADVSKSYISMLEKNKHPKTGKPIFPSAMLLKKIADALGMPLNELREKIEPADWTSKFRLKEKPSELELELFRQTLEEEKNRYPHQAEIEVLVNALSEKNRIRLIRYAKLLLEEQEEDA